MKKMGGILSLFVISVLLISIISSVSFVSAIQVITGRIIENETETTNETELEVCPSIIGWRIENNKCVSDSGCNYDSSGYTYYNSPEECEEQLEPEAQCGEGIAECLSEQKKYCEDSNACTEINEYKCIDSKCVSVSSSKGCSPCPYGCKDGVCLIKETEAEEEPDPRTEPKPRPETCAAKIKINFDKDNYAAGDSFKVEVSVFDSQENPIPNYPFYARMYDNMWHSPDFKTTGSDGYFRDSGETPKKTIQGITKGIFNVYTKEIGSCKSVEDTTEISLKKPELVPVPCGMGSCIPIEETPEEPTEISKDKIFYQCNGCKLEDKCYPIGYRKNGMYCSDNDKFISQIDNQCDNNFECKSNVCISGECISEGLMKKIIKWFKKSFGGDENEDEEEPGLEICSKLLIEKDIGDNEYIKTEYGSNEHIQVPVHLEDGENVGTLKCCAADYSTGMVMVCPYDSKEEVRNSLRWILGSGKAGSYEFGEYKGGGVLNIISDGGILAWTSDSYLVASGGKPGAGGKFVEEIVDAYFKKYSSDFDLTEDDIPYVLDPMKPETWVSCVSEKDISTEECYFFDDFEGDLKKWTFSNEGLGYDGAGEAVIEDGNTYMRLVGVNRANIHRIWDNYLFKFRFKMIEGYVHVDFRRSETPGYGAKRYVVSINGQKVSNLNREINQDFQKLEEIDLNLDNNWHTLEIRCYGDIINVYVDNELVAKHKDTISPLLSGWVRFEAHTGGVPGVVPELLVDDVEIKLITEDDIVYP